MESANLRSAESPEVVCQLLQESVDESATFATPQTFFIKMNTEQTPEQPSKRNNRSIFYIALLLILLGVNIYLYIKYNQRSNETAQLTEQVNNDSIRITDLNKKYQEALVSIESYKGQNAQLDSIIAVKEKEMQQYKDNIAELQRKKKISDAEYQKQRDALNATVADLQNQVASLQQQLKVEISRNDSLGKNLAMQMSTNSQLTNTNQTLSKKVTIGSLLKPTSINATGIRIKSSGHEDETSSAKKSEKLKVCFDVPANDVADEGEKTFYVRIISPEGITLAVESSGSGIIKLAESGQTVQYSSAATIDYQKTQASKCAYWEQSAPYSKGSYTAEIYQDGYLVGTKKFDLK